MKRVILFLVKQLILFGFFYLTLNLYSNSNFNNPEGKDITITIVSGDTENDSLVLDPDTLSGWGRKKVTWSIGSTAAIVKSFEIDKKKSSPQVFQWIDREPRSQTRKGKGRFKNVSKKVDYVYSIVWYDTIGGKHTFDPKIAVKPSPNRFLAQLIYIVYALFAALISFLTFRKK